jgi:hypothetical protein
VPGCRATRHLDVHHVVHREDGGDHKLSNLTLMCFGCHERHHEGRLVIVLRLVGGASRRPRAWTRRRDLSTERTRRSAQRNSFSSQARWDRRWCCAASSRQPRKSENTRLGHQP